MNTKQAFCLLLLVFGLINAFPCLAEAATKKVMIKGFQFEPAEISIKKGDSVEFTNLDSAPHTVAPEQGAVFEHSGRMLKNEQKIVVFKEAGTQHYFCDLHPSMKGVVKVTK